MRTTRILSGLAAGCYRGAIPIIVLSLVFLACCPFILRGLRLEADSARLISSSDPIAAAYREGELHHGEVNPLVVELRFPGVAGSLVDAFTDQLVEMLKAEADITKVEQGTVDLLDGEDAPRRLRAALLNSHPPLLEELVGRLDETGLRRSLRRARTRLVSVEDLELRRLIASDVLDLTGLIAPFYLQRIGFLPERIGGRTFDSPDGSSRLLFIQPEGSSEDSEYCLDLLGRIETAAARIKGKLDGAEAIELRFTGVHAMTAESAETLMQDLTRMTAVATVLLFLLSWLSFGRLRVTLICFYPLVVSLGAVLVLARTFFNPINYVTIGFAAIVMGLGLDVGLHLTARALRFARHADTAEALRLTFSDSGPPVTIGTTSTAAAFLALVFAQNRGMTQFGLLTAAGLMLSLAITLVVFPAVARYLLPAGGTYSSGLGVWWIRGRWLRLGASYPVLSLALALLVVLAGLGLARGFRFDADIHNLMPRDLQAVELAERIAEDHGLSPTSLLQVALTADSADRALVAQQGLDEELARLVRQGTVAAFRSPSELLVYPQAIGETAALRKRAATTLRTERGTFFELLDELRFRPSPQHQAYYSQLQESLGDVPQVWEPDLRRFAVFDGGLYRLQTTVWPAVKGTAGHGVNDSALTHSVARRLQHLFEPLDVSLQVTGILLVYERMNEMLRQAFLEVSWIACMFVAGLVLVFFRSPVRTILSMLPLAAALPVTIGLIVACGISFPPSAIAFGAVIVGIGIDDAVHIISRCPKGQASTVGSVVEEIGPVITLTSLSTVIGFGSLALSRLPVVSSLGLVIAIGVAACWIFALLLLPAVFTLISRKNFTRAVVTGGILLCASPAARAQDRSAEDILARLDDRLAKTEAVSCAFEQTKLVSQLKGEFHGKGTLLFQQPHFLKMTLVGNENLALYANGETVWFIDHDLDEVIEFPFAASAGDRQLARLLPPFLFSKSSDLKRRFAVHYEGEEQGLHVLEFLPVNAATDPVRSMRFVLDGKDRLRRTRIEYVNGDRVETTYRNWRVLGRVSPHVFVYYGDQEAEE